MANVDLCRTCCQLKFGFEEIFATFPNQIAHMSNQIALKSDTKKIELYIGKRVKNCQCWSLQDVLSTEVRFSGGK